jgi:hypothetical protein
VANESRGGVDVKKPSIAIAVVLALAWLVGLGVPALAEEQQVVQATVAVPPILISITVDPGFIDFGEVSPGGSSGLRACNIYNTGTVSADIFMRASDAVTPDGLNTWALGDGGPGADIFAVTAGYHSPGSMDGASYLGPDNHLVGWKDPGEGASWPLEVWAPTTVSYRGVYNFSVTVVATERTI